MKTTKLKTIMKLIKEVSYDNATSTITI